MFTFFMFWDKLHVSDNDSVIAIVSRYDEDSKDGPSDCTRSSPDSEGVFDEDKDEEEALEIRNPSSRRSSNFVPLHHREDVRDGVLPLVLEFSWSIDVETPFACVSCVGRWGCECCSV